MKTMFHRLLTVGLPLGLLATAALAQTADAPRGPRPHHRPPGPPIVRALDVDHDGELSAGEIASAASSLRVLDANADGALSADELHPPRPADAPSAPAGENRPRRPDPFIAALDTDGDGALSAAEVAQAPARLATLDTNHDGKITLDEVRPEGTAQRPARRPGHGN